MKTVVFRLRVAAFLLPLLLAAGCASKPSPEAVRQQDLERAALQNPPAKVRLGSYARVELKSVSIASEARAREVDELARRMDRMLGYQLDPLWRHVIHVPRDVAFSPDAEGTLQIEPTVVETKLVSRFEREILTWAAGDTFVVIKVAFRDSQTGEAVAEPQFFRKSDLFWASWSGGVQDLEVEEDLIRDIVRYTRDNL